VFGFIDDPHAAAAKLFEDAVVRDGPPNERVRGRHSPAILGCDLRQVNESAGFCQPNLEFDSGKYLVEQQSETPPLPEDGKCLRGTNQREERRGVREGKDEPEMLNGPEAGACGIERAAGGSSTVIQTMAEAARSGVNERVSGKPV